MKLFTRILIALFLLVLLFATPIIVLGQEVTEQVTQVNFQESFESVPALAALILIATAWLAELIIKLGWSIKLESITKGWKQYLSWLVGLLLSAAGYFLQWGLFVGAQWYYIFIYGLTASLVANGLFKWEFFKTILEAIKLLPKTKTELNADNAD